MYLLQSSVSVHCNKPRITIQYYIFSAFPKTFILGLLGEKNTSSNQKQIRIDCSYQYTVHNIFRRKKENFLWIGSLQLLAISIVPSLTAVCCC
jgi:hypothetical protein